jgi:hypothetical protein
MQATRPQGFLAQAGTNGKRASGTWTSLKLWRNDPAGAGTPYKSIQGNAATVNADAWKRGPDAS